MKIKLLCFFDTTDDGKYLDKSKVHFCKETFDQNIDEFKTFFASSDANINDIEFQVYLQNELNPIDRDYDAIRCMMSDIKNEDSCTHKLMAPFFDIADTVEKKIAMLCCLLEKFFLGTRSQSTWADDGNHIECYHCFWGSYGFKYWLPKTIIKKYGKVYNKYSATEFDITLMTPEELLTYVVPVYYREIGWWDMKSFRNNEANMAKVSVSWLR